MEARDESGSGSPNSRRARIRARIAPKVAPGPRGSLAGVISGVGLRDGKNEAENARDRATRTHGARDINFHRRRTTLAELERARAPARSPAAKYFDKSPRYLAETPPAKSSRASARAL